jgi:hypothetical protein
MTGTGKSVDMTETHEEDAKKNVLEIFMTVAKELRSQQRFAIAMKLLKKSKNPEAFLTAVNREIRGSVVNNLILGASALGGLLLGTLAGRLTAPFQWAKVGRVPLVALLGVAGVVPGALMDETLTVRNTFSLGGLMFSAGAVIEGLRSK